MTTDFSKTAASQIKSGMADVASIVIPPDRQRQNLGDLSDLKTSIKAIGLLSPIVVEPVPDNPGYYTLIAGERRLRCVQELGWQTVAIRLYSSLTPDERVRIELEENIKRKQLDWREEAKAVQRYVVLNPNMTQEQIAKELGVSTAYISRCLDYAKNESKMPEIKQASTLSAAVNIIKRKESRKLDAVLDGLPADKIVETALAEVPPEPPKPAQKWQVQQADFIEWAQQYSGPRFNLLHCDFPYGIGIDSYKFEGRGSNWKADNSLYEDTPDLYWSLLDALLANRDRIIADSAHIIFWFSMKHYTETVSRFTAAGFSVEPFPFVWGKSDNRGVVSGRGKNPWRRTYETALVISIGDRQIVRSAANIVWEPTEKAGHFSTKPLPVVEHLMQVFCDESTILLDPTCGSGTSIAASLSFKPTYALGLDINPEFVSLATNNIRKQELFLEKLSS